MHTDNKKNMGFDLDVIPHVRTNVPTTNKQNTCVPKAPPPPNPDPLSVDRTMASSRMKWAMLASCILLVFVTALMLTVSSNVNIFRWLSDNDDLPRPETYVSIGPLISSVDSGDLIRMTLDIGCNKKSYRKKITELDAEIRNRLVWAFQRAEAEKLMAAGDYFALRAYLSESVMEILPKGTVSEIYMSEFLRY